MSTVTIFAKEINWCCINSTWSYWCWKLFSSSKRDSTHS